MSKARVWMMVMLFAGVVSVSDALAGDVEVVKTVFELHGESWHVSTTLKHADSGWDHYADAWRVVNEKGDILATRTLYHPHETEQPFTRGLSNVHIPAGLNIVYVEAHDKVHGWSKQRIRVDLRKSKGDRYEIRR